MQVEQNVLEHKNNELQNAFREKSLAHTKTQKLYQNLKAHLMGNTVAQAAVDEADFATHAVRADRYDDKLPGTRTSAANLNQMGTQQEQIGGRQRNRSTASRSSEGGVQPRGGIRLNPAWSQMQGHSLPGRGYTGRELSFFPGMEVPVTRVLLLLCILHADQKAQNLRRGVHHRNNLRDSAAVSPSLAVDVKTHTRLPTRVFPISLLLWKGHNSSVV
jgi:hypothetical protein